MINWNPELLSPAGSLEKLKVAILYGADAVYLGGQKFGLREASENFTLEELAEGVAFAHEKKKKVFVVLNSFLHDSDFEELPDFLSALSELKVDAVIVSDLGVVAEIQKRSRLVVHLSTQSSCINTQAALFWKDMGVTRIVLGREVSIKEAGEIKEVSGLEIEMFIHGSMCMSYSGNCVISNYTQGRDSNRGGCAHSCRFEYSFEQEGKEKKRAYFMSSKDLMGLSVIEDFHRYKIDSLKIEGRNKGPHYAGTVSKVYQEALRFYHQHGHFLSDDMLLWEKELRKLAHRDYTTASLLHPADRTSIYNEREHDDNDYVVCAVVLDVVSERYLILDVKSAFKKGDVLEFMPFLGPNMTVILTEVNTLKDSEVLKTKPGTLVKIPWILGVEKYNLVRMRVPKC